MARLNSHMGIVQDSALIQDPKPEPPDPPTPPAPVCGGKCWKCKYVQKAIEVNCNAEEVIIRVNKLPTNLNRNQSICICIPNICVKCRDIKITDGINSWKICGMKFRYLTHGILKVRQTQLNCSKSN